MRDNSIKLTDKLTFKIIRGLAFSASLVSALTFMNLTGGSSSLLAQNNSGNDNIQKQGGGNSTNGGRGNDNSRFDSDNNYHDDRTHYDNDRRIETRGNYNEKIQRDSIDRRTDCNQGMFDRSVCGNLDGGMNNY